jgi:hypothetical protein
VAKGKSNSSAKASANSSAKRKAPPSNKDGKPSTPTKEPAAAPPAISNEQIGHVAGDLWHFLDKEGPQNLASIKKAIAAAQADLVLAAIGWLAREGKLQFTASGRSVTISLR